MTLEGNIMKIVPGLQATALLGQNVKLANFAFSPKASPKKTSKMFVKTSVTNILGTGLIGPTASMINTL